MSTDAELRGKWERADEQLTILVGAAATDLLNQPPHMVALAMAKLLNERYDRETVIGYAAMAITRLGMAEKERLSDEQDTVVVKLSPGPVSGPVAAHFPEQVIAEANGLTQEAPSTDPSPEPS